MSDDYKKYKGEEIMSNYDGKVVEETVKAIKGKELFSHYTGWNFCGRVWWENDKWLCEVYRYGSYNQTFINDALEEIMKDVCSEYGSE